MTTDIERSHSYPVLDVGHVARLIAQPEDDQGRSEWRWVWLENGDLMVGFFPRGDSFSDCEVAFTEDWQIAEGQGTIIYHHEQEDWSPGVLEQMVQDERRKEAGSVSTEQVGIRDLRLGDLINLIEPDGHTNGAAFPIKAIVDLDEDGVRIEVLDTDGDTWARTFNAPTEPSFTIYGRHA